MVHFSCEVTAQRQVSYASIPRLGLPDTSLCEGEPWSVDLSGLAATITWPDGSQGPKYVFSEAGNYLIQLDNACGSYPDSLIIEALSCTCPVYVPSAFSPNGDGHNDRFLIQSNCDLLAYELQIFNRWGKQVFQSSNLSSAWDGADPAAGSEGVYTWLLRYQYQGRGGLRWEQQAGTVTVWR